MATAARQRTKGLRRLLRQIGAVRLLVTVLLIAAGVYVARDSWDLPLLGDAERGLYDLRFEQSAPRLDQADPDITLVTYQESTLATLQKRSPLDRRTLAQALRAIDAMRPKAIGIDILFDQPQAEDDELIDALRSMRTPTFIAFTTFAATPGQMDPQQEEYLRSFIARAETDRVRAATIRLDEDGKDGVMRRWPERQADLPPLLANAMYPQRTDMADYRGAIAFRLPRSDNPNDEIPAFPEIPIETFSAAGDPSLPPEAREALLSAPELRNIIANRFILIGGNIKNADDFATPMSRNTLGSTKGIVIHAHMLRQLLDGDARPAPSPALLWLAAVIAALCGALTALLEFRSIFFALGLVLQLALIAFLPFFLQQQGVDTLTIPAAGWATGWLLSFLGVSLAARAVGAEQRKFAHSALGKYLPVDIANEIMRDPDQLTLTGEKKEIYALFTDLGGFTALSHAIEPEQLTTLLNRYLDQMSDTVLEYGGTIDKFVGDAVVAFWGAPIARDDDGDRAARAAVAMFQCGEAFRRSVDPALPPVLETRVGLHKGQAVVGNFGGDKRIQYTALGDGMNTAARLESANKELGTFILVSAEAKRGTTLDFFRPMGRVRLVGRSTPVELWEPVPDMDPALRDRLAALWERFDGGDAAALEELAAISAERTEDRALAKMVQRLRAVGPGGAYEMNLK